MERKELTTGLDSTARTTTSYLAIIQYVIYGSLILYFGRDIFIPLSFAALISFVLYPICAWMERKGIGWTAAIAISVSVLTILLLALTGILARQIVGFLAEWPSIQSKLGQSIDSVSRLLIDTFGITRDQQSQWMSKAADSTFSNALAFAKNAISVSAFSAVMAILIPVYSILILYHRRLWLNLLFRIFPSESKESIREIISLTIQAYYNFIKGMGIVYVAVGVLNSLGLLLLGVPNPFLFGFIASILTFIPYVGIMVGSLLPVTIAWATHDSAWYAVGVIGVFVFVQYLEANVIFPFAVSNRLKVNTLVVLIAIFLGGILWGVAGMILFVPFVGIAKLIADHDPRLSMLSMALGTGTDRALADRESL